MSIPEFELSIRAIPLSSFSCILPESPLNSSSTETTSFTSTPPSSRAAAEAATKAVLYAELLYPGLREAEKISFPPRLRKRRVEPETSEMPEAFSVSRTKSGVLPVSEMFA